MQSKDEFEDSNIGLEDELDSQTDLHISINHPAVSDEKISVNKTVQKTEIHKDTKKEEFKVLQLKDNVLPRVLAPLEELFDFNDFSRKPKMEPTGTNIEQCNIGSDKNPKVIKLSKSLPLMAKRKYIDLFKEFIYVFSWIYEDLKAYDTSIIQHKIPIREHQKPFKHKLCRINLILMPLVEKESQE